MGGINPAFNAGVDAAFDARGGDSGSGTGNAAGALSFCKALAGAPEGARTHPAQIPDQPLQCPRDDIGPPRADQQALRQDAGCR